MSDHPEGIAIIGLAGRFPEAPDAGAFWQNLVAGKDCLRRFTDAELAAAGYDPAAVRALPGYVGVRGVIDRPEWFDRAFFNVPPREAEVMDPQHRVLMEVAWEALEDAGCDPARYDGLIGAFAGMSNNTYYANFVQKRPDLLEAVGIVGAVIANEKDFLATRLAYKLNLRGPALNVQTACSSSLVAVCVACQQLNDHQCDVALAGGVSVTFPQDRGYFYQEGGMTSGDGHCRPFDARANGTVFSSAAGIVILKRLADALADGDQIYTVIKGYALNNDGAQKVSFAAPSVQGHAEVIALAHAVAEVDPATISYVEAHGTATPLGDPIEIEGLTQAFRSGTEARGFCALSSVKGNMGHADAASGITSLIKAALAFKHEQIPPTIQCEEPNPALHLEESPFFLSTELRDWKRGPQPRRAGVSSFGVGGTNAHVVLEDAPAPVATTSRRTAQLLVLSAKTATALERRAAALADHLEADPELSLADVAATLQTGRQTFAQRRFVVAENVPQAIERLRKPERASREDARGETPVAFLFPGQGSQYAKMGAQLYATEPAFREAFDRCTAVLDPLLGVSLRAVIDGEGDLRETRFTQPAIFAIGYALAQYWLSLGVQPGALVGHSVGEFVAATVAGVFSLEDAARVVAERARLIQDLPRGAMLAVRLGETEVQALIEGHGVDLAAINSPRLCVVSGPFGEIEKIEAKCLAQEITTRRLETSHAFHSSMVDPVVEPLAALLRTVPLHAPALPILSTVTGEWLTEAEATDPAYWSRHARATVRFCPAAARLLEHAQYAVLECGPGLGLSQLARQQPARTAQHDFVHSLEDGAGETESTLTALGRLWAAGVPIDWARVQDGEPRWRVSLPTYPFERQRYFADLPAGTPLPLATMATDGEAPVLAVAAPAPLPAAISEADESTAAAPEQPPLLTQIKRLLSDLSGLDVTTAEPTTSLLELGFDSLFLTQIALALRKRFAIKLTLRQLMADLATLDKLTEYIAQNSTVATPVTPATPAPILPRLPSLPISASAPAPQTKRFGPYKPIETAAGGALTDRQRAHLAELTASYSRKYAESKRRTQEDRAHLADPRTAGSFHRLWKEMVFPIVVERSAGARIWDVDGNEWVDMSMGFGTNLLGHSPAFITEALTEQLQRGIEVGPQTPLAGEVARLLCELTGMERAAFCNTGSEAVMAAMRIARTVTGRTRIATTSGFHGINDEVLVRSATINGERVSVPVAPGIPEHIVKDVLVLEFGTQAALDTLRAHAHELAAVLIEPVQSRRLELQPIEFMREVRKITRESETALIFDELITGFRSHPGGAQALFGIKADIATYGKVIGGGLPIGVVAGSATYMDALDGGAWQYGDDSFPEVGVTFFAGTYIRHPLAVAGAWAVLNHLREQGPALQAGLSARSAEIAQTLNAFFTERGVPVHLQNWASIFYLEFDDQAKLAPLLFFHLREKGLHLWDGRPFFLSTAHTEADVEFIIRVFKESVLEMQRGGFLPEAAESGTGVPPVGQAGVPPAEWSDRPLAVISAGGTPAGPTGGTPVPRWADPAPAKPMQFSLYYFGSYPAAYSEDKYKLVIEGAKFADRQGFEAVWLPERHFHSVGGFSPNPAVVASALARETTRIALRGGSVVLPLHHPIRIAEEWSVVDNLSNGRVGISIASGWHPNDFVLAPDRFARRREICHEEIQTIRKLWRGETLPFRTGQGGDFGVKLHPLPKQPELPLWLTCIHPESFAKAGEMGVSVLGYLMNQSVDELAEKIRIYRATLAQHGHDPAKGHVTVLILTHVGEDRETTLRQARGPMREYLRSYLDNKQKRLETARGPMEIDQDDVDLLLDRAFEDYVQGKALIGSPESCAPIVEKLAAIGVDEIGCFIDFGVNEDAVLRSLPHLDTLRARFQDGAPETELPLTPSQAGLLMLTSMSPEAARVYGESTTLELRGKLHVETLRRAIESMPARHDGLRTTVAPGAQRIHPEAALDVPFVDFSARPEGELLAFLAEHERAPFDFSRAPLMRGLIVKLAEDHHLLVLTFHHLVGNGPSYTAFIHEVIASYEALCQGRAPQSSRAMQLRDFVAWEKSREPAARAAEAFWLAQFSGELPVLELPLDHPRPPRQTFAGARATLTIGRELTAALRQTATKQRASLFMIVFSAYNLLLHRLSGQSDVVVAVPFEGEIRTLEGGHGLYANTTHMLPLRSRIDGDPAFSTYLDGRKQLVLDASEQQDLFFGELLAKLNVKRDARLSPLFSAAFNFENGEFHQALPGLEITASMEKYPHRTPGGMTMFELNLNVAENAGELVCQLDHAEMFDPATAQRWLGHFRVLLEAIAAAPETPVAALPLLDPAERALMLEQWNDTARDFAGDALLHEMFEAQAARTPDAVAVSDESSALTFAALDRRASDLARRLPLGADVLAGIYLERSCDMAVALLAVLKAGGTYVPLDPGYPAERLAYMIRDARMPVILTNAALADSLPPSEARVVRVDAPGEPLTERVAPRGQSANLAYVIYTSGSTGTPKGVMISHGAACNFLRWAQEALPLSPADRVLHKAPTSFDVSVLEIFQPLVTGAELVMARPGGERDAGYVVRTIQERGITILQAVPAFLEMLTGERGLEHCTTLRSLYAAGEALPAPLADRFLARLPTCALWNLYGPTEATVYASAHLCRPGETVSPIGRPVANTQFFILDAQRRPVPIGVAGELLIGGASLARGYWNQPALTDEKFIQWEGRRVYRTGDLARWLPTGEVEYLGRLDHQIKLRGFRIELGEIETAMRRIRGIGQCAVLARELGEGDRRLVAYYTRNGEEPPVADELRERLFQTLPAYMVPASFVQLSEFPLTASGKVALRRLPSPAAAPRAIETPRNALESQLVEIWQELLGRREIGTRDNFFDLGGHSLLAARMLTLIDERLGRRIEFGALFDHPTIAEIALLLLRDQERGAAELPYVAIHPQGTRTPVFFLHGDYVGGGFFCKTLAQEIGPDRPFYAVHPHGLHGDTPPGSIEAMANDRLRAIRAIQPHGPYILGGYCNGALVAYEMARRLEAEGEEVSALLMLMADGSNYRHRQLHRLASVVGSVRGEDETRRRERFLDWRRKDWFVRGCIVHYTKAVQNLVRQPWPVMRSRVVRKARRILARLTSAPGESEPLQIPFTTPQLVSDAFGFAFSDYIPAPYGGPVTLLWPEEQAPMEGCDEAYGWSSVCPNYELRFIPGQHHSCVAKVENVRRIGAVMRETLEAGDPAAPIRSPLVLA
ncbi:MAG TPA: MupA/Atu3671 family FMN-dependent luciferase-like monooxygenase [Chthoniobacteraceae bacterium]|jgi:natural product biosynthesis luciferase-like monooxygenase protein/amino acid adenylation domain-containing protein|nr:MupA/Atu3671 family FMN-dependent luciferase-like monooxygenase [Chthoniobacteraceae bacterium]